MSIGVLVLSLLIPGCGSLKEKRGRLRPLLTKLRKEFNLSIAEIDDLDIWQSAIIACAVVSNDPKQTRKVLQKVSDWVESNWRDVDVVDDQIEIF